VTFYAFFAGMLRPGFAMAAAGLLLFFVVGGSVWNMVIGPVADWDSKTLLAEAQAIDTQIHLADLQYSDPGYERQRLISPDTNFNSIAIIVSPEGSDLPISTISDATPTSTDPAADDADNATSTSPVIADGGADPADVVTSTPAEPEDTTIGVEEALDILSQ
jgi:hypothetical protein